MVAPPMWKWKKIAAIYVIYCLAMLIFDLLFGRQCHPFAMRIANRRPKFIIVGSLENGKFTTSSRFYYSKESFDASSVSPQTFKDWVSAEILIYNTQKLPIDHESLVLEKLVINGNDKKWTVVCKPKLFSRPSRNGIDYRYGYIFMDVNTEYRLAFKKQDGTRIASGNKSIYFPGITTPNPSKRDLSDYINWYAVLWACFVFAFLPFALAASYGVVFFAYCIFKNAFNPTPSGAAASAPEDANQTPAPEEVV